MRFPDTGRLPVAVRRAVRANEIPCNGVSLLHAPACGMPRGARRVEPSVVVGLAVCAIRPGRGGKMRRNGSFSAWHGALRAGAQGAAKRMACNAAFTASQFLSQRAIPVSPRGPAQALGWAPDCIHAPFAKKTHANPVGGRGISAFSARFFLRTDFSAARDLPQLVEPGGIGGA